MIRALGHTISDGLAIYFRCAPVVVEYWNAVVTRKQLLILRDLLASIPRV